jgi:CHC2 zinc finger
MLRANPVYQGRPERRGVSCRRVIDEAKANVPVIDLGDLLCGPSKMRRVGEEWTARCPLNDHEDKTPSFTVNPEKNVWFCHGCLRGGDVVELARFAWNFDKAEVAAAAAYLLMEFGYEVPQRPQRWLEKEARHTRWREEAEKVRAEVVRRRIFRLLILPTINRIEKEEERAEELERAWRDFSGISWKMFVYWDNAA